MSVIGVGRESDYTQEKNNFFRSFFSHTNFENLYEMKQKNKIIPSRIVDYFPAQLPIGNGIGNHFFISFHFQNLYGNKWKRVIIPSHT